MNFFKKSLLVMAVLIGSLLSSGVTAHGNEVGFSVEPVFPKNQLDQSSGYFHLLMKEGQKQTIQVKLKNTKDTEVELSAWVSSAKTNVNGVVDYSDNKSDADASLQYDLADMVKMEKDIKLPPKSEQTVDIEVAMLEARMEGIVAGGLTFEEKNPGGTKALTSQTGVKNKFSYVVALLVQQDSEILLEPELAIGKVAPTQLNSKSAISAEIRNVAGIFLNDMAISVDIVDKKSEKVAFQMKKENMQMAPNSTMKFPVFLNGEKLKPGDYEYRAHVSGKSSADDGDMQEWDLTADFTVDNKEAKKLNDTDTQLPEKQGLSWWIWLLIALNVIVLGGIILFVVKKQKASKKKRKKRRKKKK
ncbi:DUF916 and DUF3324 domain-containing protein [Vagococcus sp. DIV0080]|uniref:DUF916 and DUF3324 domain-containing protein n=1 Tax=Candidatus Vagococcus giribetii TaxID=2230876 RepID=A0ABS3HUW4_9ENTE|nr:DUF916 and DUF3324 domain-containing protein [Vagococcus sp. DIV0080]MBO0477547.1 DUF916 and DUF3324 domain-containing protein [Vagococcus sp. DIV0080]